MKENSFNKLKKLADEALKGKDKIRGIGEWLDFHMKASHLNAILKYMKYTELATMITMTSTTLKLTKPKGFNYLKGVMLDVVNGIYDILTIDESYAMSDFVRDETNESLPPIKIDFYIARITTAKNDANYLFIFNDEIIFCHSDKEARSVLEACRDKYKSMLDR